jgi:hypothetical protein
MFNMRAISRPLNVTVLAKLLRKGQHAEHNENIEVLFGRQAEFVVALDLPHHLHLAAIREDLRALDLDLPDTLADTALQYGKGDGGKILFLDGQIDEVRV